MQHNSYVRRLRHIGDMEIWRSRWQSERNVFYLTIFRLKLVERVTIILERFIHLIKKNQKIFMMQFS